jgi:hypothetical protein
MKLEHLHRSFDQLVELSKYLAKVIAAVDTDAYTAEVITTTLESVIKRIEQLAMDICVAERVEREEKIWAILRHTPKYKDAEAA